MFLGLSAQDKGSVGQAEIQRSHTHSGFTGELVLEKIRSCRQVGSRYFCISRYLRIMLQHPATSAAAARLRGEGGCGGRAQHAAAAVPGGQADLGRLGLGDLLGQRRHLRLLGLLGQHRHLPQLPPRQGDNTVWRLVLEKVPSEGS